jgi:spore coat polysaccharide biosynthesis protein SpsF (cytidylyltransferase family)
MMVLLIQARLSSARLPDKVLYQINGKPLSKYLIKRLTSIVEGDIFKINIFLIYMKT